MIRDTIPMAPLRLSVELQRSGGNEHSKWLEVTAVGLCSASADHEALEPLVLRPEGGLVVPLSRMVAEHDPACRSYKVTNRRAI